MKAKAILLIFIVAMLAAGGGWFAAKRFGQERKDAPATGRKVLYYQSPMHPWITSDKPGRCTICGMQLEPIHEGERGFGGGEGVVTLGSNSVQVINVQTEIVTNRPLVRTLRVAGLIDDNDTTHRRLSAYAEGRVEKLFVNHVGADVKAGEPLAILYSPALLAAESEYLTLLQQKPSPDLSETLRAERLRLTQAAGQRLRRLGYSEAQIAALAKKDSADARTEILAPMTGTVVARNVYEGQYVKEGDLLFEMADFATMWFQFDAYERDLGSLHVGQIVEVTTPAAPGKVFSAPITFIDPNLNEMTRSAKVRVELQNPMVVDGERRQRLLAHKMYADGVVKLATPAALAIPRSAVLSAGQPMVFVEVGAGAYEPRQVKLGRRGDDFWEVLEGVAAGERVVTSGGLLLDAQAQLNASMRSAEGPARGHDQTSTSSNQAVASSGLVILSDEQQQAAKEFFVLVGDLSATLAADSLARFNEVAPRVHAAVPKLVNSVGNVKALRPTLLKLEQSGHLDPARDLAAARKAFLPLSMAAVELAAQLRTNEAVKTVKIFNCPMVDRAIPGAAKNGRWVQVQGPLRNPFFGAEMLECGVEIKP